jgi:hypothetical protein
MAKSDQVNRASDKTQYIKAIYLGKPPSGILEFELRLPNYFNEFAQQNSEQAFKALREAAYSLSDQTMSLDTSNTTLKKGNKPKMATVKIGFVTNKSGEIPLQDIFTNKGKSPLERFEDILSTEVEQRGKTPKVL